MFVLNLAADFDAKIISNDYYEGCRDQFSWIDRCRVPLMIVDSALAIYHLKSATEE